MPSPTLASLSALAGFVARVVVGVGDLAATNNPAAVLATYSLGSCLGVSAYDPVLHVGGLLHFMLPDSSINLEKARRQPAMFADTGLPALIRAVEGLRAQRSRLQFCVAGGAQIMDQGAVFNIGQRNCVAYTEFMRANGLRTSAEQVGGLVSRTMTLHLGTGEVRLKLGGVTAETLLFKG